MAKDRKNFGGKATLSIPRRLHNLISAIGEKERLYNYEVAEKAINIYVKKFCPELSQRIDGKDRKCAR